MRDFRKYEIWVKAIKIAKLVYEISSQLPNAEKYGLASQIQRAAVSIASNIAEGSARTSDVEFKRFLEIALGSAYELETQLTIINEIGLVTDADNIKSVQQLVIEEQKMLTGFISTLKHH